MPDHVHLLLEVSPKENIAKIVDMTKDYTSYALDQELPVFKKPLCAPAKLISSVEAATLKVVKYIEGQATS